MTTTIEGTFGDRVRARREELGLSKAALADLCGVSDAMVYYWETDTNLPEAAKIPTVARALRISSGTVGRWLEHSPRATLPAGRTNPGLLNPLTYPFATPFRPHVLRPVRAVA